MAREKQFPTMKNRVMRVPHKLVERHLLSGASDHVMQVTFFLIVGGQTGHQYE